MNLHHRVDPVHVLSCLTYYINIFMYHKSLTREWNNWNYRTKFTISDHHVLWFCFSFCSTDAQALSRVYQHIYCTVYCGYRWKLQVTPSKTEIFQNNVKKSVIIPVDSHLEEKVHQIKNIHTTRMYFGNCSRSPLIFANFDPLTGANCSKIKQ